MDSQAQSKTPQKKKVFQISIVRWSKWTWQTNLIRNKLNRALTIRSVFKWKWIKFLTFRKNSCSDENLKLSLPFCSPKSIFRFLLVLVLSLVSILHLLTWMQGITRGFFSSTFLVPIMPLSSTARIISASDFSSSTFSNPRLSSFINMSNGVC